MSAPPFRRLLVANRGEIALRVLRTAHELGVETVAVYSDADRNALHVRRADRAVHIGPPAPAQSYLCAERIVDAAVADRCDAIHPGYGFLSENAGFAQACAAAGITFVGPPPGAIELMGNKVAARAAAAEAGVPVVPGVERAGIDAADLMRDAERIGFPVMLKAAAGGGGKGIRIVERAEDLAEALQLARAEARGAFGDDTVYLEKFLSRPRHVEIQVMADAHGGVVHYGERECSVQRRHQKLVEESPSAVVTPRLRESMGEAACALARAVGYQGAGTVEFLHSEGEFYFLEMNTRLQVEHPVTEMCYGVDLVAEQLRIAAGGKVHEPGEPQGHAIEVRINAEDPATFLPSLGVISRINVPGGPGVRLDAALFRGLEVTPHYDSMIGKLIVHATDRDRAIRRMRRALRETRIVGVATTIPVALSVLADARFVGGDYDTSILEGVDRSLAPDLVEAASLAAAVARFCRAEQVDPPTDEAAATISPWTMAGRLERLAGRPR